MNSVQVIFFGSTSDSVIVLEKLYDKSSLSIASVVTQPPRPVGRHKTLTPTPAELFGKTHDIPILSFPTNPKERWLYADENYVADTLSSLKPDLLVSASFGEKIPTPPIRAARFGGLNVHPSILPRWRGADPVPWAIVAGDHQIGVTVMTLAEQLDQGLILAQKKIPLLGNATSDAARTELFVIGSDLLVEILPDLLSDNLKGNSQKYSEDIAKHAPFTRRLVRDDGFVPWKLIELGMAGASIQKEQFYSMPIAIDLVSIAYEGDEPISIAIIIERMFRAFHPWPGVWSTIETRNLRLKIMQCHLEKEKLVIDSVQLEGKTPVPYTQFQKAYTP